MTKKYFAKIIANGASESAEEKRRIYLGKFLNKSKYLVQHIGQENCKSG